MGGEAAADGAPTGSFRRRDLRRSTQPVVARNLDVPGVALRDGPINLAHVRVDADERSFGAGVLPRALREPKHDRNREQRHAANVRDPLHDGGADAQARERPRPAVERDAVQARKPDTRGRQQLVGDGEQPLRLLARRAKLAHEQTGRGLERHGANAARSLECEEIHDAATAASRTATASPARLAANSSAESKSSMTGIAGKLARKVAPYGRVRRRGSPSTMSPRSSKSRMSRPTPCFSASTACGSCSSVNASPPALRTASARAWTSGSLGTANGSLSMTTSRNARPRTSTPCQKLPVPSRTALPSERNWFSSSLREPRP